MEFKISKELIQQIEQLIETKQESQLELLLNDMHHADIAEILDELDFDEATYIFKILDSEKTAEILLELEDDLREKINKGLAEIKADGTYAKIEAKWFNKGAAAAPASAASPPMVPAVDEPPDTSNAARAPD